MRIINLLLTSSWILIFPASQTITVFGYENGHRKQILVESIPSRNSETPFYLEINAARKFKEMHASAAKDGVELKVNSAYRTYEQQKQLRKRHGVLAAKPGHSNHQLGLAVDIDVSRNISNIPSSPELFRFCSRKQKHWECPTITYWWLVRNAKKFGFRQTLDYEKWHWVYNEFTTENSRKSFFQD